MASTLFSTIIFEQAKKYGERPAFFSRSQAGWQPQSWLGFAEETRKCALSLLNYGVQIQQTVAIYAQNMPENFYIDYANYAIRAVSVPLFATASVSQLTYILKDAGVNILFAGEENQYQNALQALPNIPSLKLIVVMDPSVNIDAHFPAMHYHEFIATYHRPEAQAELAHRQQTTDEEDLALIMYTSGTTGEQKGVMLKHTSFREAMRIHDDAVPYFTEADRSVAFLPLSHIFERAWCYYCFYKGAKVYINLRPQEIQTSLKEIRPTAMCSVPRFWEKVYQGVKEHLDHFSPAMKGLVVWALALGEIYHLHYLRVGKKPPLWLKLRYQLVDRLIFSKVKKTVGIENGNIFPVAGAALDDSINIFFRSMGIPIVIGYGLTETTASVSCFRQTNYKIGTIGKPMLNVQIRIGEEHEIQVKGKTVTAGYYNKPEATSAAFVDGWFKTGDAGKIDEEGNLILIERIKDLFKTSNGKYIAPQQLEMKLGSDKNIEQVAVIGDQRNYVTAIVVPNMETVHQLAKQHGIAFQLEDELLEHPVVMEFYRKLIDQLQQEMASFEKIKKFTLIKKAFSIETGELTSTLKLRRAIILQNYHQQIEAMYHAS
ncbi:MAG: AMP-dependent synthetase/ligase [Microbacter sp.]